MHLSIAFHDLAALQERCEVSGVRITRAEPEYENGAVVPAGPWQPISEALATHLRATDQTSDSCLVEMVKLRHTDTTEMLAELADPLGDPDATYLGQAASPAKALTTTDNYRDGRRIGLHVDNWDKLRYAEKHQGRRRLCLNLGPGARYILLGDIDIQAICRTVHDDYEHRYPHTDDLRTYVARHKPLRCFRIRLAPGEGYIAPTELLPHDGSTEDQPEPSTAAFWLGHWPRSVLPSLI
ncbi:hypothetical protein GCM10010430_48820 [Kitasatospora cystarginea]|uniref:Uncharacterized protein n=1 Tax=Kitasatospora cystarginea TaxID=58350 RepID=A0ABN3EI34_9ACTN